MIDAMIDPTQLYTLGGCIVLAGVIIACSIVWAVCRLTDKE